MRVRVYKNYSWNKILFARERIRHVFKEERMEIARTTLLCQAILRHNRRPRPFLCFIFIAWFSLSEALSFYDRILTRIFTDPNDLAQLTCNRRRRSWLERAVLFRTLERREILKMSMFKICELFKYLNWVAGSRRYWWLGYTRKITELRSLAPLLYNHGETNRW